MGLDRATRKQLTEARDRIKAQLIDDERAAQNTLGRGGPPDLGGVYAELTEELRQIDEILGRNPDEEDDGEPGGQDEEVLATPAAVASDYQPLAQIDTDMNALSSRVVVDDGPSWSVGRFALVAAALAVGIAFALLIAK